MLADSTSSDPLVAELYENLRIRKAGLEWLLFWEQCKAYLRTRSYVTDFINAEVGQILSLAKTLPLSSARTIPLYTGRDRDESSIISYLQEVAAACPDYYLNMRVLEELLKWHDDILSSLTPFWVENRNEVMVQSAVFGTFLSKARPLNTNLHSTPV